MKTILRKVGAYICYGLGILLVLGWFLGERQYLLGAPGFISLGMILDGYAE